MDADPHADLSALSDMSQDVLSEMNWKSLKEFISDLTVTMDVEEEVGDLRAAQHAVNTRSDQQAAELARIAEEVNALQAELDAAAAKARRPEGQPSADEHDARVRSLEEDHFRVVKELEERQGALARREEDLRRTKAERDEVRAWDPTAGGKDADMNALRIQMYEEMGFTLTDTTPVRILVSNSTRTDIQTCTVDAAERVASANRLWAAAS